MHELYWDCLLAHDILKEEFVVAPPWIQDVIVMSFVNGHAPSDHEYLIRPAA